MDYISRYVGWILLKVRFKIIKMRLLYEIRILILMVKF